MSNTLEIIRNTLNQAFVPCTISVSDQSKHHLNHPEAMQHGGGHYHVVIISEKFNHQSRLQRHRMVHHCVQSLFNGKIHALSIQAYTPEESRYVS